MFVNKDNIIVMMEIVYLVNLYVLLDQFAQQNIQFYVQIINVLLISQNVKKQYHVLKIYHIDVEQEYVEHHI